MRNVLQCCLALLISISLVACTSYREVRLTGEAAVSTNGIAAGDRVRLTSTSGEVRKLTVVSIEPDAIVCRAGGQAENERIALADIAQIERREVGKVKTTGLVLGIVVIAAGAVVAWAAGSILSTTP